MVHNEVYEIKVNSEINNKLALKNNRKQFGVFCFVMP